MSGFCRTCGWTACNCPPNPDRPASSSKPILLWPVRYGRISAKPVKCIDLGNGEIKVVGMCLMKQPRDGRNESYHETYKSAMMRFVADAQRDVNDADKNLKNAKRRLKAARSKWSSFVASPNEGHP